MLNYQMFTLYIMHNDSPQPPLTFDQKIIQIHAMVQKILATNFYGVNHLEFIFEGPELRGQGPLSPQPDSVLS